MKNLKILVLIINALLSIQCAAQVDTLSKSDFEDKNEVRKSDASSADSTDSLENNEIHPIREVDTFQDYNQVSTTQKQNSTILIAFIYFLYFLVAVLIAIGLYRYFRKTLKLFHFTNPIFVIPPGQQPRQILLISGQFSTKADDFLVGELISIYFALQLEQPRYQKLKELINSGMPLPIFNTESPKSANYDMREIKHPFDIRKWIINSGCLEAVKFEDEKCVIYFKGDVIFNKPGNLKFTGPLEALLEEIVIELPVAPRYIGAQITTNKIMELLTFLILALTAFSISIFLQSQ